MGSLARDFRVDWLSLCKVRGVFLFILFSLVRSCMWWMAASMANVSAWKTVECLPRKPFPSANSSGLFGSVLEKMQ